MKTIKQLIFCTIYLILANGVQGMCHAEDLVVTGVISGTQNYDSQEGLIFDTAILEPSSIVTAISTFEVILLPGTHIQSGAELTVYIRDDDGVPNQCEMYYFGNLYHGPDEDYDSDIITNYEECILGTNPADMDMDNDDDGLLDWWEIKYANLNLDFFDGVDGDADGDGISNGVEFQMDSDPTVTNEYGPGLYYKYDDLGRIVRILRIPGR